MWNRLATRRCVQPPGLMAWISTGCALHSRWAEVTVTSENLLAHAASVRKPRPSRTHRSGSDMCYAQSVLQRTTQCHSVPLVQGETNGEATQWIIPSANDMQGVEDMSV